jgi:hypothetical protein
MEISIRLLVWLLPEILDHKEGVTQSHKGKGVNQAPAGYNAVDSGNENAMEARK